MEDVSAKYPLDDPSGTALQLGLSVRRSMGGTSGVLYDIFFNAAASHLKSNTIPASGRSDRSNHSVLVLPTKM